MTTWYVSDNLFPIQKASSAEGGTAERGTPPTRSEHENGRFPFFYAFSSANAVMTCLQLIDKVPDLSQDSFAHFNTRQPRIGHERICPSKPASVSRDKSVPFRNIFIREALVILRW